MIGIGQQTYVPDDTFEQCLIELGIDNILDDFVLTSSIDTVTNLPLWMCGVFWTDTIFDLTGIEGFVNLRLLNIDYGHQLRRIDLSQNIQLEYLSLQREYDYDSLGNWIAFDTLGIDTLDLSNNINLIDLDAENNDLHFLDLRNGNNSNMIHVNVETNFHLSCINVDDSLWASANWGYGPQWGEWDIQHFFSNNCSSITSISETQTVDKTLIKITDILGRKTKEAPNAPLFYIFKDGTVEKRIIIE